ncbi:MAG: DNA primase [Phycisphaeraceae bacterium]
MPTRLHQKEQVQQATDIVRLVGEHVALRPRGREFIGLCPFHDDQNPSMYVSPAKQIFKCFSCGAGGDVFSFVTRFHKMTFPEALRHLAERAGITLEAQSPGQQQASGQRQRIAGANAQGLEFFRAVYNHPEHGQPARDYVQQRGISDDMVEAFQIGYAPDRWDGLTQTVTSKHWPADDFEAAGLITARSNGPGRYDRLRHRLIFPIFDAIGRPIAFGGRKLRDEDEPKYLNSPETILFNKSATLYGLHLAKKPIIDSSTAVIVEGYTDVIACHQAGAANVVATLGTALTAQHVAELRRYAERVVLVFDADEAGAKAADRAVELFLTGEVDVAIAVLPAGQDPAELLAGEGGLTRWHAVLEAARDALAHQLDRVRAQLEAAGTVTGRQHVAEAYIQDLARLGVSRTGGIRRALVVQQLAGLMHMSEQAVSDLLTRATAARGSRPVTQPEPEAGGARISSGEPELHDGEPGSGSVSPHRLKAVALAERQVIGALVRDNELLYASLPDGQTVDEAIAPAEMVTAAGRDLYARLYDRLCEGEAVSVASLAGALAADGLESLVELLTQADADVERAIAGGAESAEHVLLAAVLALRHHHGEQAYQDRRQALSATPSDERLLRELIERRRASPSPSRIARPRM